MATGWLYQSACYGSSSDVLAAYYNNVPIAHTAGATSYRNYYTLATGTWSYRQESIASNGTVTTRSTTAAVNPTFPSCQTEQTFLDGLAVGWAIAGVLAMAFGGRLVRRQLGYGSCSDDLMVSGGRV